MRPHRRRERRRFFSDSAGYAPRLWAAKAFFWVSLALSLLIAAAAIWGKGGWLELRQPRRELLRLEVRRDAVEKENRKVRAEVEALTELTEVEKIAREELGLVKPGETVYELSD